MTAPLIDPSDVFLPTGPDYPLLPVEPVDLDAMEASSE